MIRAGAEIWEGAKIGKGRKNITKNIVIHGLGETKTMTAFDCNDGLIITIGCRNNYKGDTYDNIMDRIKDKYKNKNHPYYAAMRLIKSWAKYEKII